MSIEWSGLSPHLLVTLDRTSTTHLRSQLEAHLREAIRSGRLTAGERLPSSRSLATQLGISRGLVQDCFAQLQAEGYLVSRGGSATRVATIQAVSRPAPEPPPAPEPGPRLRANFDSGVPDLASVPREDWAWAIREACRHAPNAAFDYGEPRGASRLREVVAAYLRRVRAVDAHADQVVVCGGFAQGLALVARALAKSGVTCAALEDPGGLRSNTRAFEPAGITVVPVPVDGLGIDVEALDASGARAVVLTPAHQWPTGVVMAAERRHAVIAWARARDAVVIEDDYDAEFRYDREPVGSLQGLDPSRVVSLGSVSKSLSPALRLGWAVVPDAIAEDVMDAKLAADRSTPVLDQLALATLIESGRYDRHLRRMRAEYSARRDVLVEALAQHAPAVRLTGLAAGFHAVAHLPDGTDEQVVIAAARDRGVGLYAMSTYRSTHATSPPQLVFGFGNTTQREIKEGIAVIADLLAG